MDKKRKKFNREKKTDEKYESFLRRRTRYRIPKQSVAFPYSELNRNLS